jgi:hypothetical protein
MSKLPEKPSALVGHFALLDPDTESGLESDPFRIWINSTGSADVESCVVFRVPAPPEWLPSAVADVSPSRRSNISKRNPAMRTRKRKR